jgi:hypothetical protein
VTNRKMKFSELNGASVSEIFLCSSFVRECNFDKILSFHVIWTLSQSRRICWPCLFNDFFLHLWWRYMNIHLVFSAFTYKLTYLLEFKMKSNSKILYYSRSPVLNAKDWTIGVLGFDFRQGLRIFLFTTSSRNSLRPTQPPIQWVPVLFPWG